MAGTGPTGRCRGRRRPPAPWNTRAPSRHHSPLLVSVPFAVRRRGGDRSRRGHFAASRRTPGRRRGRPATRGGRGTPRRRRAAGTGGDGGSKFAATMASNSARTHAGSASTSSANPSATAERAILSGIVVHSPDRLAMSPGHVLLSLIRIAPRDDRFKSSKDPRVPRDIFSGYTRPEQPAAAVFTGRPRARDRSGGPDLAAFRRSVTVQFACVPESAVSQHFPEITRWPGADVAAYGRPARAWERSRIRPRRRRTAWFPDAKTCSPWW